MSERAAHLEWCKKRAREYVDAGRLGEAVAAMTSDLAKHPDTANYPPILDVRGVSAVLLDNPSRVREWINGFN